MIFKRQNQNSKWCVAVGLLLVFLMCIPGASAFNGKTHYDLIAQTLMEEGFDPMEIEQAQIYNQLVDVSQGADSKWYVDWFTWKDDRPGTTLTIHHASKYGHFGGFEGYSQINREWDRLQGATYTVVKQADEADDTDAFIAALGMSLHTVEDFYGHSNWSIRSENGDWEGDATWFDVTEDVKKKGDLNTYHNPDPYKMCGIYTVEPWTNQTSGRTYLGYTRDLMDYCDGVYGGCNPRFTKVEEGIVDPACEQLNDACEHCYSPDDDPIPHKILNMDNASSAHYDTSYREAYYASRQWVALLRSWVRPEFWERVKNEHTKSEKTIDTAQKRLMLMSMYTGYWDADTSSDNMQLLDLEFGHDIDNSFYSTFDDAAATIYNPRFGEIPQYPYFEVPAFPHNYVTVPEYKWFTLETDYVKQTDCDLFDNIDSDACVAECTGSINDWVMSIDQADFFNVLSVHMDTSDGTTSYVNDYYEAPYNGHDELSYDDLKDVRWAHIIPVPMTETMFTAWYRLHDDDQIDSGSPVWHHEICDIDPKENTEFYEFVIDTTKMNTRLHLGSEGLIDCGVNENGFPTSVGDGNEALVVFHYTVESYPRAGDAKVVIVVTPTNYRVMSGDLVTYTYTVTNLAFPPLNRIGVTDSNGLTPIYARGDANFNNQLDYGETWVYSATTPVTSTENLLTTIGTVTARRVVGSSTPVTNTSYPLTIEILHPGLQFEKTASPSMIHSGDSVTYTYNVSNSGDFWFKDVNVTDDQGVIPQYMGYKMILYTGESMIFKGTATLTTTDPSVTNVATLEANDTTGFARHYTRTAEAVVRVLHPAILLDKSVSSPSITRGESVTYTYTVSNAGDIELSDIQVTDDAATPVYQSGDTNGDGYLNLTEVWKYTATASPKKTVTNTAKASGTDPLGMTVSSTKSTTVTVTVIVNIDVKPGGCPNGLALKDKGTIPVAILGGMPDYALNEIKLSSIKINGITVTKISSADVATPYIGKDACGCTEKSADGNIDAVFQVDAVKVISTLGNPAKKSLIPITVTGTLTDGLTLVKGSDCIKIA